MSGDDVQSEAQLIMRFESGEAAEMVLEALAPDNEPLPRGLRISVQREGSAVIFKISSKRSVMSLLATLDDIISMAALAERSIRIAIGSGSS